MNDRSDLMPDQFGEYTSKLQAVLTNFEWTGVKELACALKTCWNEDRSVLICGNGGSAANAMHLANDFLYGISSSHKPGLRIVALSANPSVMTCLANDEGYEKIFSLQLAVHGRPRDILIVLSGSGNSPNIIHVLEQAHAQGIRSFAILGFTGGRAKEIADVPIHFPVSDMQISEDLQLIVGHMLMRYLKLNR